MKKASVSEVSAQKLQQEPWGLTPTKERVRSRASKNKESGHCEGSTVMMGTQVLQ